MGGALAALLLLTSCQPIPSLDITFGGDIMLAREGQALFTESPWPDFVISDSDLGPANETLFFANLESPLAESGVRTQTEGYNLCADAKQVELLKSGGLSIVSTANNHQADCGEFENTGSILAEQGILSANIKIGPEYIQTIVGVVGVIAVDTVAQNLDLNELLEQVRSARQICDILVVSLHWGFEYAVEPSAFQLEWAQKLSDGGVDILWGHHPHVLQPVKWITAAQGNHRMLAMYSLGNLLTDQWMTWETENSTIITVRLNASGIDSISFKPIHMDPASRKLVTPSAESIERIESRLGLQK